MCFRISEFHLATAWRNSLEIELGNTVFVSTINGEYASVGTRAIHTMSKSPIITRGLHGHEKDTSRSSWGNIVQGVP